MIEVFTSNTPNGKKITIMLEEIGYEYKITKININKDEQFKPEFEKISPFRKIPVIIDHDKNLSLFESGAILIYLAEKAGKLLPTDTKGRSLVIQWLMFQMGGIGPMMGQANVFFRYWPEKIQPAIDRYQNEGRRLFEVLDGQLKDHEYLAGDFSIADIANWCWVRTYAWSGINVDGLDNLKRWRGQIAERPGCQKGVTVPVDIIKAMQARLKENNDLVKTGSTIVQK